MNISHTTRLILGAIGLVLIKHVINLYNLYYTLYISHIRIHTFHRYICLLLNI